MWRYVNYYKSVHHPITILPDGIGNTKAVFKTNQYALLSVEFPRMFSFWPKSRGEEGLFRRLGEGGLHCEITPRSTWLS